MPARAARKGNDKSTHCVHVLEGEDCLNNYPSKQQLNRLRQKYPIGTRIVLLSKENAFHALPAAGTKGTVTGVNSLGHIEMQWDNGFTISLVPGIDAFSKESPPEQKRSHELER